MCEGSRSPVQRHRKSRFGDVERPAHERSASVFLFECETHKMRNPEVHLLVHAADECFASGGNRSTLLLTDEGLQYREELARLDGYWNDNRCPCKGEGRLGSFSALPTQ
ncbi:unnamed protein product [Ectocarpus sp. 6 AP-2014]